MQNFFGNVVRLGQDNNIKLKIDEIIEEKTSRRSDSSNELMDFDVVCDGDECNI